MAGSQQVITDGQGRRLQMTDVGVLPYYGGKSWYVDYANGNDNYPGTAAKPKKTIEAAYDLAGDSSATDGKNDCIYVLAGGGSGTTYTQRIVRGSGGATTPVGFSWDKSNLHLYGVVPSGMKQHQRARISSVTSTPDTTITTLFKINASNCYFSNLAFWIGHAGNVAQTALHVAGTGNIVENCNLQSAHASNTSAFSLLLEGGEHQFSDCVIGNTTIGKGSGTTVVNVPAGTLGALTTARTKFLNCRFETYATHAAHTFVTIGEYGIDRYMEFDNCRFYNGLGTTMTQAFSSHANQNGDILMPGTWQKGATNWSTANLTYMYVEPVYAGSGTEVTKAGGRLVAVIAT